MESVLRGAAIYLFLMLVFRISGKRMLSQMTAFDLVLLLIIGEASSQALIGEDFSFVNAAIVIATLVLVERAFVYLKQASPALDRWLDDAPLVVAAHGRVLPQRMRTAHLDEGDIVEAARAAHGLETMDDVKYAVLERDGSISIIPRRIPR
jgi:uncharacterized membrane protein YcaP (DUF421 family)